MLKVFDDDAEGDQPINPKRSTVVPKTRVRTVSDHKPVEGLP